MVLDPESRPSVLACPKKIAIRYRINDMLIRNRSYMEVPGKRMSPRSPTFVVRNSMSISSEQEEGPPRSKAFIGAPGCPEPPALYPEKFQPEISTTITSGLSPFTGMLTKLHTLQESNRHHHRMPIAEVKLKARPQSAQKSGISGHRLIQFEPETLRDMRKPRPQSAGSLRQESFLDLTPHRKSREKRKRPKTAIVPRVSALSPKAGFDPKFDARLFDDNFGNNSFIVIPSMSQSALSNQSIQI